MGALRQETSQSCRPRAGRSHCTSSLAITRQHFGAGERAARSPVLRGRMRQSAGSLRSALGEPGALWAAHSTAWQARVAAGGHDLPLALVRAVGPCGAPCAEAASTSHSLQRWASWLAAQPRALLSGRQADEDHGLVAASSSGATPAAVHRPLGPRQCSDAACSRESASVRPGEVRQLQATWSTAGSSPSNATTRSVLIVSGGLRQSAQGAASSTLCQQLRSLSSASPSLFAYE